MAAIGATVYLSTKPHAIRTAVFLILIQIFTRSGRNLNMPIETLHFLIITN